MIDLNNYIIKEEIKQIFEELKTDDNSFYKLKKEIDKYRFIFS